MRRALTALLLCAPLVLAACGDSEPPRAGDSGATASPLQPGVGSGVPDDAQPAQVVGVTVTGDEISGDTGPVRVAVGSRVRLTVVSDVAGLLVVQGYGLEQQVALGPSTQVELVADRAGTFRVTLDDRVLTTLDVG